MQIFYEPEILTNGGVLNEEESKHCIKVLRHKAGDQIYVIDGRGTRVLCSITEASPKACRVKIEQKETGQPDAPACHIAIAPTKSIDRFEWFLEKSTELGIDRITPLLCHQSERRQIKLPRLDRVITAATKQCLRLWRPSIAELTEIKKFLDAPHPEKYKFIAHCMEDERKELITELKKNKAKEDILILIGPEGDFAPEEVKMAIKNGFIPVVMGKNRLRTETAGIAACMLAKIPELYK
ncbi:16S rRNA (uracil(1498)-N(3))-methyltransferase [Marinilabilia salmonicolor]|uniref:16S rRNA (uracil(1498)-N(3))-methyltransferase n=1 Tax=Marinilabilia salmonicolor TaxID=989 RepID=UPI00029B2E2F|nr:16S rRNA (uracil(1498)-N(3))-methyltransferase [Marinilabilia salmonicolor]